MSHSGDTPQVTATRETEETFFERFSRRKHEARQKGVAAPSEKGVGTSAPTAVPPADLSKQPDVADSLTDADMPDIASLNEQSDYTGFLSAKVSESLRRAALRKLFHSTAFNIVDELDDYNEDFTTFESLGDIVTAEMRHRDEIERRRDIEREALDQAPDQDAVVGEGANPADGGVQGPKDASTADPQAVDQPTKSDALEADLEDKQDDEPAAPV